MRATGVPVRTSTPRRSSCARAFADSASGNVDEHARPGFEQQHARAAPDRCCGIRLRSVWRAISASVPASSTPVGPPPTTANVSQAARARGIGLGFGALEREQHAAADRERVVERLQAGRVRRPFVVAEIGVGRAAGTASSVS